MSKIPDLELFEDENVSEEIKIPAITAEIAEQSIEVNSDESVNVESPAEPDVEIHVESLVESAQGIENPDEQAPEIEASEEIPSFSPEILHGEKEEIPSGLDKTQIIDLLAETVQQDISRAVKNKVEALKRAFYKQQKIETDKAQSAFIAEGGILENFQPATDALEDKLKELLAVFRKKKAVIAAKTEKIQNENPLRKQAIIERLKELIESKNDFFKIYVEYRKLQQQWKEIKEIPQTAINKLHKDYQYYSEQFYDLLKINNEMRNYDFKKNLELKQGLIESVEKLANEKNVISASYQLQIFHREWREIGPVAKELRVEIREKFKTASSVINKKHQEYFNTLRLAEEKIIKEKIAICEEMEAIDYSKLSSFKEWNQQNKRVVELQKRWRTTGYASKKSSTEVEVYERFRKLCDVFFQNKKFFFQEIKETMNVNLKKKEAICEQAEALKDSQDWKETTIKLVALQKEWNATGTVSKKFVAVLWKRFRAACNYFFEQKDLSFSSQKLEKDENLNRKKEIIRKINELDVNLPKDEALFQFHQLMYEWNNIGLVPLHEKEKLHKEYDAAIDKQADRLKIDKLEKRLQSFISDLGYIASDEQSKNRLWGERERLIRAYEKLKSEIQTYENNIGFFSVSSKNGSNLIKDLNLKINKLKEELNFTVKKIEAIDENLEK